MSRSQFTAATATILIVWFAVTAVQAEVPDITREATQGTVSKSTTRENTYDVDFEDHGANKGNGGRSDGDGGNGSGGRGGNQGGATQWSEKSGGVGNKPDQNESGGPRGSNGSLAPPRMTFTGGEMAPRPRPAPTPDDATRKRQTEEARRHWELIKEMSKNAFDRLPDAGERLKDAIERNPDMLEWFGKYGTNINVGWTIAEIVFESEDIGVDEYPYDYRYSDFGKWMQTSGGLAEIGAPPFGPVPETDGSVRVIPASEPAKRKGFGPESTETSR